MIPVRGYEGARVAVLGLGRSGLATARALRAGGAEALLWDDNPEARARAQEHGFALHDPSGSGIRSDVAALVVSPGVPHLYPKPNPAVVAAWDANVPIDNDVGLFFRSAEHEGRGAFDTPPRIVAVTGSNGKSTTAALIHHALRSSGRPAQLAGNIGRAVLDLEPPGDGDTIVLELSSYQTDLARSLAPDIAVFTNLTADHLDRHGGMGGYFAAKRRLFTEGQPDCAVIGVDEAEGQFLANSMTAESGDSRVIRISGHRRVPYPGRAVIACDGILSEYRDGQRTASADLRGAAGLPGQHNLQNAGTAYAVVRTLGLPPHLVEKALLDFQGLPHRGQIVGRNNGVTFVNDSKATNADSAAWALRAFGRIRWIAGGQGKDGGLDAVLPHLGSVAKAYLIGHSAHEFAIALGNTPHEICETMDRAVARATEEAEAGDTVLLAPAAASFDQFPDFEKRGEAFVAAVATITRD